MKEIYPNRKRFFFDFLLSLFLTWTVTFIALIVSKQYLAAIVVSCLMFGLLVVFGLLPIKLWFTKIRFDENSISRMFRQNVQRQILWQDVKRVVFAKGKRHSLILEKSSDYKDNISMPCNNKVIEILAIYTQRATNAEFIGTETLSSEQLKKLKITKFN